MTTPRIQAADMAKPLPTHKLRALATSAECDPRTVENYVQGVPVRGQVVERIERSLKSNGLGHLVVTQPESLARSFGPRSKA
jgi:hypothetical protein